jgi:ComF family protein
VEPVAGADGIVAFAAFGGALATAIRRLKYGDRPDLARPLGDLLRRAVSEVAPRIELVVPVPLHVRRLAHRGYNQSALLASRLARGLSVPCSPLALVRRVDTPPQAELARAERLTNVADVFDAARRSSVRGRRIALVDDVATTGATLGACARALRDAGAAHVLGVVIARTS